MSRRTTEETKPNTKKQTNWEQNNTITTYI